MKISPKDIAKDYIHNRVITPEYIYLVMGQPFRCSLCGGQHTKGELIYTRCYRKARTTYIKPILPETILLLKLSSEGERLLSKVHPRIIKYRPRIILTAPLQLLEERKKQWQEATHEYVAQRFKKMKVDREIIKERNEDGTISKVVIKDYHMEVNNRRNEWNTFSDRIVLRLFSQNGKPKRGMRLLEVDNKLKYALIQQTRIIRGRKVKIIYLVRCKPHGYLCIEIGRVVVP